jgi:hypothetical protein
VGEAERLMPPSDILMARAMGDVLAVVYSTCGDISTCGDGDRAAVEVGRKQLASFGDELTRRNAREFTKSHGLPPKEVEW